MNKVVSYSLDKNIINKLENFSENTGVNKSKVVEECLKDLFKMDSIVKKWKGEL